MSGCGGGEVEDLINIQLVFQVTMGNNAADDTFNQRIANIFVVQMSVKLNSIRMQRRSLTRAISKRGGDVTNDVTRSTHSPTPTRVRDGRRFRELAARGTRGGFFFPRIANTRFTFTCWIILVKIDRYCFRGAIEFFN